ncbi:MAG: (Fe-S)-binding protein [Spirochaetales bacterium]|nr:(Fe-S)-binding protein [Spirochaetales bacterium]
MIDRFASGFDPFVIPFLIGMAFVLVYCLVGAVRLVFQLDHGDRKRFLLSLITPKTVWKNLKDIFLNCLIHVKLWKRNKLLGYMHSSIAFGWFMLIVMGHIECFIYMPHRVKLFYYPIFFNYIVAENESTIGGAVIMFLMDFFLLMVLSGIVLAIIKRVRSRLFGMRRTTSPTLLDRVGLYSLWLIFPLRLLAESFTAHISGGSFLTIPANMMFKAFLGDQMNMLPTWWAYSICLCIFMCVLPFTRYMHIPAEMLLIPFRNAGLTIKHARRGFAKAQVYSCPNCGVCIDACPMSVKKANIKDTTVYLNRSIRRGNEQRIEEISDKCLLCGKCTAVCQVGVDGPQMRIAQRSIRNYGLDQDYSGIDIAPIKETVSADPSPDRVLYFAGCMTSLTPAISKAMESVFRKAGVDYAFMDRDGGLCCGRPILMAGRFDQARQLIRKNKEIIKASGAATLVLSCPICCKVFREHYKLEGIRVLHHTEYMLELVKAGKLELEAGVGSIVYHDPCELGRGCGVYEQPRELLRMTGDLLEATQNRDMSICCGGSLGSLSLGFDKREDLTKNALSNLTAANPDTIVTACPLCKTTFAMYSDRPVEDIVETVNKHLK